MTKCLFVETRSRCENCRARASRRGHRRQGDEGAPRTRTGSVRESANIRLSYMKRSFETVARNGLLETGARKVAVLIKRTWEDFEGARAQAKWVCKTIISTSGKSYKEWAIAVGMTSIACNNTKRFHARRAAIALVVDLIWGTRAFTWTELIRAYSWEITIWPAIRSFEYQLSKYFSNISSSSRTSATFTNTPEDGRLIAGRSLLESGFAQYRFCKCSTNIPNCSRMPQSFWLLSRSSSGSPSRA